MNLQDVSVGLQGDEKTGDTFLIIDPRACNMRIDP